MRLGSASLERRRRSPGRNSARGRAMPGLKSAVRRRRITALTVKLAVVGVLALMLGFAGFVWLLPSQEVAFDRNADGIVVLTGGTARVPDALELLAAGRGKRLLITGVNPDTTTTD